MPELHNRTLPSAGTSGGMLLPDNLLENLQLIADGAVAVAGFEVAAIRMRRGDDLELVVDTGLPEEVGNRIPVQLMLEELSVAEDWGLLRFVPHERGSDGAGWVVPDFTVSDDPDAWHPMDMLVAPLYDAEGELRGTFAIDCPVNGRRPDAESRRALERFAGLAARAVLSAVERESLAAQVAMAETVKSVVRTSSAQLSLDGLLRASEQTLLEGFGAQHLWIQTVSEDEHGGEEYLPNELRLALPDEIVAFAQKAARYCWHEQLVMIVGDGYPVPDRMAPQHFDHVLALLHEMEMSSLVFVPLGAGPECMGSLVLIRADAREWTGIECHALLDIGHDLGRAALNARTFEREHALVTELQALDAYKSQLISTVSHELKNPLTSVSGHLEMLMSGTIPITEQAHSSLTAIGRASKRMARVIEDLLYLRKVGEPERRLRLESVDLRELVADALAMTSMSIVGKDLEVRFEPPHKPVLALGERDDLDKVVINLVSNAVKYTPERRRIAISVTAYAEMVALTVTDEGIGISEDDQANLFTEFFRSSNPAATAQPGTGLGLTIVKRIVERHQGTIQLESTLGRGSTFVVTLPTAAVRPLEAVS